MSVTYLNKEDFTAKVKNGNIWEINRLLSTFSLLGVVRVRPCRLF